ncbi:MAG: baseplate J/gp47 family protein [Bacteroidota bacterium]
MEPNCHTRNPIQRDGTSQRQRLPSALIPEYIGIDERSTSDLKQFIQSFAELIRFHHPEKTGANEWTIDDTTNWTKFFETSLNINGGTEAHYALVQAFLEIFRFAQDDLNTLTERHLEYYIREVLRLKPAKPVPDKAFLIFELANHVKEHLVPKGTLLKAGKDQLGNNVFYATDEEVVINEASVVDVKALLKIAQEQTNPYHRLYASPIANSSDGLGGDIETDIQSWDTFGNTNRPQAEVGFAFASPLLFLAEGTRTVTFRITFENVPDPISDADLDQNIKTYFSGEEGWISPVTEAFELIDEEIRAVASRRAVNFLNNAKSWQEIAGVEPQEGPVFDDPMRGYGDQIRDYDIGQTVAERILTVRDARPGGKFETLSQVKDEVSYMGQDKIDDLIYSFNDTFHETRFDGNDLIIIRTINPNQDPIVAYNEKVLLEPFKTKWPVMKVLLATDQENTYLYDQLAALKVARATVTVDVSDVKTVVVQNDRSLLDPAKHFLPFGIVPSLGANFYIGSWEVFQKKLDHLAVNYKWHGLPEGDHGFRDHYYYYLDQFATPDDTTPIPDCIGIEAPAKRNNTSFAANLSILDKKEWTPLGGSRLFKDGYCSPLSEDNTIAVTQDATLSSVARDTTLDPVEIFDTESRKGFVRLELAGVDFGHKDFQPSFTKIVLKNAGNPDEFGLPSEPYTPTIKEISLDYISHASIDYTSGFDNDIEQFFHVMPFGVAEQADGTQQQKPHLLGQFTQEGELYIGLKDFNPPQNISLLFRVAEGSADPSKDLFDIQWSYLVDNEWVPFQTVDIVADSTNGLITSGIVKLSVDKSATIENTLLPKGVHWIRATVEKNAAAIPDTIAILAQAVTANFQDRNNDPNYLSEALPAGSIKKLAVSDAAISKVVQPYASCGGQIEEQGEDFYTRVSERLRHKHRAITIWDYERLVLAKFPNTYKVKCLNHTHFDEGTYSEIAPGHVTVLLIPDVQNQNAIDPLRPETSVNTLEEVKAYLATLNAAPIEIHVRNPRYEGIQVNFKVRFKPGLDFGFYQKQLETEIKTFLSPWAFQSVQDIVFGGRIHKSQVLNFVEERDYVDVVTCFDMWHVPDEQNDPTTRNKVDEVVATTSASILGSVGQFSQTGDHGIIELETDDEGTVLCQCPDNEVAPPPVLPSADDCPCESDLSELYDWDDSLIPSAEADCSLEALEELVLENADNATYFNGPPQNVILNRASATYFLATSTESRPGVRTEEVITDRILRLSGDLSAYAGHRFENNFRKAANSNVYHVFDGTNADYATHITPLSGEGGDWPYTDGQSTWVYIENLAHNVEEGDYLDFYEQGATQFQNVFLPKVDQAMVDNNVTLRLQIICSGANSIVLRRNVESGKDRLQNVAALDTAEASISLQHEGGVFSLELVAQRFDPLTGHNDLGWQVIEQNVNYYAVAAAALFEASQDPTPPEEEPENE